MDMAADAAKGFFGGLIRASASALANSITNTVVDNPHDVQEIIGRAAADGVSHYPISKRDKDVILHGPLQGSRGSKWLIIVHHPSNSDKMWTIYHSNDQNHALQTFNQYNGVISTLINADTALCERNTLEKICSKLREHNSLGWTSAHIASYFNFVKCLKHPSLMKYLNHQEGSLLQTPLQVAIQSRNLNSVVALIEKGVQFDIKDINSNNLIHTAAESSAEILQYVIDKLPERFSPLINDVNQDGMTPLSIACKCDLPQNVRGLLRSGSQPSIASQNEGYPIMIATKSSSILCIQELVAHSSQQVYVRDPKDGSYPIHLASGTETLNLLLELGSDPNSLDDIGKTPLHYQVQNENLKCTLQLLCRQAFPDIKDENGDTPMHIAARLCSKSILQLLIAFDADVNMANNRSQTPRHLVCTSLQSGRDEALFILDSVGAGRCPISVAETCTLGCKFSDGLPGSPPSSYFGKFTNTLVHEALHAFSATREVLARSRRESLCSDARTEDASESYIGGRLLTLDGGGIRGIVLTQVLMYLQKEFGQPIVDLFDWVAGTSTGGIMALCLAKGKSPLEIQALYLRLKDKVFTGGKPYSSQKMEEFLKEELGGETRMSNLRRPRLMITTAIADQRPANFHFFRNYLSPSVLLGEEDHCTRGPEDLYVWEVAKATGAAPSYFRLDGKYIDGGLVGNNPTLDALTELTQFASVMRVNGQSSVVVSKLPSVVVSIGTGIQPPVRAPVSLYDISKPEGVLDALVKVPKLANVIALLVEQATQTEGQIVERSRAWCASIGAPFFRFSPKLSKFIDLDETDDVDLIQMMWETRAYLYSQHSSVIELKHILFANGTPAPV